MATPEWIAMDICCIIIGGVGIWLLSVLFIVLDSEAAARQQERETMGEVNRIVVVKGTERYIFTYDDTEASRKELFRVFVRFASNPELSFTWYDVAVLSKKLRQSQIKEPRGTTPHNPFPSPLGRDAERDG